MSIVTTAITPIELAAVRAVVESDLQQLGAALAENKPELYQALVSVQAKLARLAESRVITVSA